MKSVVRLISAVLVVAVALSSCGKDKTDYDVIYDGDKDNIGYLALGGLEASVMIDTENYQTPAKTTRADGVDINTFDVVITNSEGATVAEFKYGERPTEPISLPGGLYKLSMTSGQMSGAAWESPIYSAEKEFTIVRKQTTTVDDIVCKLANIKVTVSYSADVADQLDPAYTTMDVAIEQNELTYAMSETRAGYFEPLAAENTLKFTLNCRYVGQDKDIVMTNTIKGVKAAQWRKINVVIQHASDGTASVVIECDTWTYDEEVVFDSATFLMEEVIPDDTDMPVIAWEGYDLAEEFELTDEMFDTDGNFLKSINIDVTAKTPLASLVVKAASDNSDFTTAYTQILPLEQDLCSPTASTMLLSMMGYPTDAAGKTSTRIKFGAQAANLMHKYEGTHTYTITATDTNGRTSTETLTVTYGQNVAPRIVWVGYNIDERQTITDDMTCTIRVTAPLAIKDFEIKIVSDTLTPEELEGVGLAAEFSLVNSTEFFDSLSGLGFPTGDAVYNQTQISEDALNITGFLTILGGFSGDHDFVMTVTDMEGNVTTKTVMLHAEG